MSHTQTSYSDLARTTDKRVEAFHMAQPGAMQAFRSLSDNALQAGLLSAKTKRLIAFALAVGARCDDCIAIHVRALLDLQAAPAEIEETLAVCVHMGGEPALMYAAHALAACDQMAGKVADRARA